MIEPYLQGLSRGIKPTPKMTVAEWAAEHRVLSQRASSEPGRWRNERTPYLVEIMEVLSAWDRTEEVVFIKGAQIGASETGFNWIGYIIDHAPGPILSIQPTLQMQKRNVKLRIDPMIAESPSLKDKVADPRSRDASNTMEHKDFPGGAMVLAGANSASALRSMPAKYIFADEVDAYPGDVDGEGSPIELARARTRTFSRRKIYLVSTPTIQGKSAIETAFEKSDQRYFNVPCPECGEYQVLKWPNIKYDKANPQGAEYCCEECGSLIEEHHKTWMLANGVWIKENPDSDIAGFHLSSLYSPAGWYSWGDAASAWIEANNKKGHQKIEALKVFVNTVLGETWQDQGITAGVDVQKDRFEVEIKGWGEGLENWSIDYRVLECDTAQETSYDLLDKLLAEEFGAYKINMMAIDSGYNTQFVYNWARTHGPARVIPVKGVEGLQQPIGSVKSMDVNLRGRRITNGVRLYNIGVSVLKSEVYGWLRLNAPTEEGQEYPSGYCHHPKYDSEYFKQLTAEQLLVKVNKSGYSKYEWQKLRPRNEVLDCTVYARAAAVAIGVDRWTSEDWESVKNNAINKSSTPTPKPRARRGSSYLNRNRRG